MGDNHCIHRRSTEFGERCYNVGTSSYFHLIMFDGCEFLVCWDPGSNRFGTSIWLDPNVLLHHSQHGEGYISVVKWKSTSDMCGKLPFWLWDLGISWFGRLFYIEVVVDKYAKHDLISTRQMSWIHYWAFYRLIWDPGIQVRIAWGQAILGTSSLGEGGL